MSRCNICGRFVAAGAPGVSWSYSYTHYTLQQRAQRLEAALREIERRTADAIEGKYLIGAAKLREIARAALAPAGTTEASDGR